MCPIRAGGSVAIAVEYGTGNTARAGSAPFFAQPFFVAEAFTTRPGSHVSRAEALRGCREILDGLHDDLPVDAFYFTGGIDDIRKGGAPG